jgi:hypothetical protein
MALFKYNNGELCNVQIDPQYGQTKIYVSASVSSADTNVKIAGFSILDQDGNISSEDAQFNDHPLDYGGQLAHKQLSLLVNCTKFFGNASSVITCTITIEAGDDLIGQFKLDDSPGPAANSVFLFLFQF